MGGKKMIKALFVKARKNRFLFEELVKRDFKQKYKRTTLGMAWSVLSPLLTLLVMRIVFTQFFGRDTPHYTTYVFCGNIIFSFFSDATKGGMVTIMNNAGIFTKVNVPKYMFLLSKNVSALVNFGLTLCVYFVFCALDGIPFSLRFVRLVYPILCLLVMNIGIGMILSALYVFFRDIQYLYEVFLTLLTYMSAIFYTVDRFGDKAELFLINPVYVYIKFFRIVVIDQMVPSNQYHLLCAFYALFFLAIGCFVYKKYNHQFLYYV